MRVEIPNTIAVTLHGLVSRGVKAAEVTDEGHLVLTLTDGSRADLGSVLGPQGARGEQGLPGPKGETGTQGQPGAQGPAGPCAPGCPCVPVSPFGPGRPCSPRAPCGPRTEPRSARLPSVSVSTRWPSSVTSAAFTPRETSPCSVTAIVFGISTRIRSPHSAAAQLPRASVVLSPCV